jgi:hypothetical protein
MTLRHRRWILWIVDDTTGYDQMLALGEWRAPFTQADWLQERRGPRAPLLARVGFDRVSVNGASPAAARTYSSWMTAGRRDYAPTPIRHRAFALRTASIGRDAAQYLRLIAPEGTATDHFARAARHWDAHTSRASIGHEVARYLRASLAANAALVKASWSAHVRPLVAARVRADRADLRDEAARALDPARPRLFGTPLDRVFNRRTNAVRRAVGLPDAQPSA